MRNEYALVDDLNGVRLPLMARVRLRRARRRHRTGLILAASIREGYNSPSKYRPIVTVSADGRRLGSRSPTEPMSKWIALPPGTHQVTFHVTRSSSSSTVKRDVHLADGEILIAYCRPKDRRFPFDRKPPPPDHWYIGVV